MLISLIKKIFGNNGSTPAAGCNIHAGRDDERWLGEFVVGEPAEHAGCSCRLAAEAPTSRYGRGKIGTGRPGRLQPGEVGMVVTEPEPEPRSGDRIGPLCATRRTGTGRVEAGRISRYDF